MAIPPGASVRLDTRDDTRWGRCVALAYGVDIVATEDTGRLGKTFNPNHTDANEFSIRLVFISFREYTEVMNWCKEYVERVLSERADVMRVRVPSRDFDRVGVLARGITFGTHVGEYVWTTDLTFVGARDPLTINNNSLISKFVPGGLDYKEYGQYFYPAGTQLAGNAAALAFGGDSPSGLNTPDPITGLLFGSPAIQPGTS